MKLLARLGGLVDGAAIRLVSAAAARRTPKRVMVDARERIEGVIEHYRTAAAAEAFFRKPAAIDVRTTRVRELPEGLVVDLAFRSAYEPSFGDYADEHGKHVENATAHVRWFRSRVPRPAMICIHGWGGGPWMLEERAFAARAWYRRGLDVALFQLPFHGLRLPPGRRAGSFFPSAHVVRTNEAFGQAVHDLRALVAYLREEDVPHVGALGMSLGGYTTALLASIEPSLDFAVPMIPAVSMSELMWRHGEHTGARARAEAAGVAREHLDAAFAIHAPLARRPLVPHARRFIIAGEGDRITPPAQATALWEHWDRPAIHWFPGGHLVQVGRTDAFRALARWLAERDLLPAHRK